MKGNACLEVFLLILDGLGAGAMDEQCLFYPGPCVEAVLDISIPNLRALGLVSLLAEGFRGQTQSGFGKCALKHESLIVI